MPTTWQKLQSLLYPVRIRKSFSAVNPVLELFYFRGRYLLGTPDAVYSDGNRYRPLVAAFTARGLKQHLHAVREVLVLGTGLASAVQVLNRYGHRPHFTLVEIDPVVMDWAMEFLPVEDIKRVRPVCADAFEFIKADTGTYDLIVVDIFFGREVPDHVTRPDFLLQCKARLRPKGHLVLNYMVNQKAEEKKAKAALEAAFDNVEELVFGINRVYIAD